MQLWFSQLNGTEQVFWAIAIVASVIFAIQAVMTLLGMDHDVDMGFEVSDGDTMDTGGAMSLFSIRSLVNFFLGFGWAGVTFLPMVESKVVTYIIAFAVGIAFAYLYIILRRSMMKLERNGAYNINDAVGQEASVYLRIPAQRTGHGKVQLSLNGSVHEFDAMTDGTELASGTKVTVKACEGSTLIV